MASVAQSPEFETAAEDSRKLNAKPSVDELLEVRLPGLASSEAIGPARRRESGKTLTLGSCMLSSSRAHKTHRSTKQRSLECGT